MAPQSKIAHTTLATNLLLDMFCHSTFYLSNNARRALCLVGAVITRLLVLSTITSSTGGCSGGALSKLSLQFDIRAVASSFSLSSSSHINAAYGFTYVLVGVGIDEYVLINSLVLFLL